MVRHSTLKDQRLHGGTSTCRVSCGRRSMRRTATDRRENTHSQTTARTNSFRCRDIFRAQARGLTQIGPLLAKVCAASTRRGKESTAAPERRVWPAVSAKYVQHPALHVAKSPIPAEWRPHPRRAPLGAKSRTPPPARPPRATSKRNPLERSLPVLFGGDTCPAKCHAKSGPSLLPHMGSSQAQSRSICSPPSRRNAPEGVSRTLHCSTTLPTGR